MLPIRATPAVECRLAMSRPMPERTSCHAYWVLPNVSGTEFTRTWAGSIRSRNLSCSRVLSSPPAEMAQSAMGPFYCPLDQKVYIDLSFYQDMKNKLGASGDFAQAYVIAHEVGHHVQNLFGIAEKVTQARMRSSQEEGNALSVRMELQADCFAGIWAKEADATAKILEEGDIEEGLNAAAAIGDDRLAEASQGYVVPDAFTHGSSEQRVRWFKKGLGRQPISATAIRSEPISYEMR